MTVFSVRGGTFLAGVALLGATAALGQTTGSPQTLTAELDKYATQNVALQGTVSGETVHVASVAPAK